MTDPRLERNYVDSEMFCMIEIAAACVRHSAAKRPRMGQVINLLIENQQNNLSNMSMTVNIKSRDFYRGNTKRNKTNIRGIIFLELLCFSGC